MSPFLHIPEEHDLFGDCPNIEEIKGKLNHNDKTILTKQLHDSFGDILLASIQHDHVMEWENKLILDLMKEKKIRPAINYPYEKLLRRIENSEKIDLMDFLIKIGYKTKEEIDVVIKSFERNDDAKHKIEKFL
jgi:hypothetical protein